MLERVGSRVRPQTLVPNLSVANKQMFEIARALEFSTICFWATLRLSTSVCGRTREPTRYSSSDDRRQTAGQSTCHPPGRVGRSPRKMFSPTLNASTKLSSW